MNVTRLEFARGCAAAIAATAVPEAIDWSFPGIVAAYAQRLDRDAPFVQHDAGRGMPAASVIKVLILLAAIRTMEEREFSWSHALTIRARDVVAGSETFGSAQPGTRATLEALARAAIAQSDNTAANVLAEWIGFEAIDAMAATAGLERTAMRRRFMDFAARAAGIDNTTTARDMGTLLYGIGNGESSGFAGVSSAGCRRIVGFMLQQEDRDTIPAGVERSVAIANKTGVLEGVRNDVAIVGIGAPDAYVVALLSSNDASAALASKRLRQLAASIDRSRGS